jgi:hypothetical protein
VIYFQGMFFGAIIVGQPHIAGGSVEHPFRVIEHEVVLGVGGDRHLVQHLGTPAQGRLGLFVVAEA